jgi:hypothetical protein
VAAWQSLVPYTPMGNTHQTYTIIVFRTAVDQQTGKEVLAGTHAKQWSTAEKAITSQKDAKGNFNTFHMVEGPKATVEAYKAAIATPDTHVVFVGHGDVADSGRGVGIRLSNGDSYGNIGSQSSAPGPTPDAPPIMSSSMFVGDPVAASSVALFGCDTYDLASQYPDTNFTGVQSGPGGTMTDTLDLAAAAFVTAGGGQAGTTAANAAIDSSPHKADTGSNVESDSSQ